MTVSNVNAGKHITLGTLDRFSNRYTANVLSPALSQQAASLGAGLSISGNTLSLDNSSGTSLDTVTLPGSSLSGTSGSSSQPVYLNNGTLTPCGFKVEVVNSLPANPDSTTIYLVLDE